MKFRRYNVIDKVFPERRKFKGSVKGITEIFTFTFYIKQCLKRTENKKKKKKTFEYLENDLLSN